LGLVFMAFPVMVGRVRLLAKVAFIVESRLRRSRLFGIAQVSAR
jgi:hypothetical protein